MADEALAQRVRLFIFEHFLEGGVPPVVEQLMREFTLSRDDASAVLRELEAAHHLATVPGTARILMAFPFSAIATPFRTVVGDRSYFANCAWDALAFHSMLKQDIRVESSCHHCALPVSVEIRGNDIVVEPKEALVYLALPPTEWWADIVTTCSNTMVFFASAEHRDASDLCAPPSSAASLTPAQVDALSEPIYARKFALDYARPSKEELLEHFAAMGLTGDYWRL